MHEIGEAFGPLPGKGRDMGFKRKVTPLPIYGQVLAIGVVVALLAAPEFVSCGEHDRAGRGEQRAEQRAHIGSAPGEHVGVLARSFDAAVPRMVFTMSVAVALAIGVVVAVLVSNAVGERETIMSCEEIDAAAVLPEHIGRSRDPRGERADAPITAPETADVVAEAVVPFEPVRGEIAQLITARPDVPRLGNHHPVSQQRSGGEFGEDRSARIKSRTARDDGGEIEAETVDPAMRHEMRQRVDHQPSHCRIGEIERVAAAGVVDERAIGRGGIGRRIKATQRQGAAVDIALARMVEHEVKDHADPRRVQRRHGLAQLRDPAGAQAGIERHHRYRIVAPVVRQAQRGQVALVDPGDNRHQLDGADVELLEVRNHGRMRQRGDGAALRFRHIGMERGEPGDIEFVDQPAAREAGRLMRHVPGRPLHNRAGHEIGGILAINGKARVLHEAAVEFERIGIDQQLGGIEPEVLLRRIGSVRAVAVARAGKIARHFCLPDLAPQGHGTARFGGAIEQAQLDCFGQRSAHGEAGHPGCDLRAERLRHVTTSGAVRPVCAAIPAIASAAAIRSASMAGVSSASLPSGAS